MLTLEIMRKMWVHGDQHVPGLIEAIAEQASTLFPKYGIDSDLMVAHFMAQCSEECGAGQEVVENMNYSAAGLEKTWPTRFGPARAARYAHNPQMIAETVYGGRMGNAPPPSSDGWLYRGHGLTQLTGKDANRNVGAKLGLDLVGDPAIACDPAHALEVGLCDFSMCTYKDESCVGWAKKDDVIMVTRALNGGEIGLGDREAWLRRWKAALNLNS